jgi:hypothetical protein
MKEYRLFNEIPGKGLVPIPGKELIQILRKASHRSGFYLIDLDPRSIPSVGSCKREVGEGPETGRIYKARKEYPELGDPEFPPTLMVEFQPIDKSANYGTIQCKPAVGTECFAEEFFDQLDEFWPDFNRLISRILELSGEPYLRIRVKEAETRLRENDAFRASTLLDRMVAQYGEDIQFTDCYIGLRNRVNKTIQRNHPDFNPVPDLR